MADRPEKTIKVGGIQLAIWANETKQGTFRSINLSKSYKDDREKDPSKQWKQTKSFKPTDIQLLQKALDKALEYLYIKDTIKPKTEDDKQDVPF
jgi:hypothetical protein